jgi:nucleobase:cation symporter-1, NCS1 family
MVQIERRGIDHVPDTERYGTPRHLGLMWAGSQWNVANVVYGTLPVVAGLDFSQTVVVILVANVTWLLPAAASLPGPEAGTTTFAVNRAVFGVNGNRFVCGCNWAMQVGYEAIDLSLVALAGTALLLQAGVHTGRTVLVALVVGGAVIQAVLPALGHRSIIRALNALAVPFLLLFVVLTVLVAQKIHVTSGHPASWSTWFVGLALATSSTGVAWSSYGSDFSRYLPAGTSPTRTVSAVFAGGAAPSTALMVLGAAVATVVRDASDPISGLPHAFAGWFLVPYLAVIIVQLLAQNSLDLYSSAVTLQAVGLRITRPQATIVDGVFSAGVAVTIVLSGSFNSALSDFLLFMLVWFTPWVAIFLVDFGLRRGRYERASLFDPDRSRLVRPGGVHVPAAIAQVAGMAAALACIHTSVFVGPVARALGGADLSIPAALVVAGPLYWALARASVPAETTLLPRRRRQPATT